jgi:hypothetical protein
MPSRKVQEHFGNAHEKRAECGNHETYYTLELLAYVSSVAQRRTSLSEKAQGNCQNCIASGCPHCSSVWLLWTHIPLYSYCRSLWSFGWFLGPPRRIPVTVCFGDPIMCPKIDDPTQDQIDKYHGKMLAG